MKHLIIDITGRVDIYDDALFEAISKVEGKNVSLLRPHKGLLSLIPKKHATSKGKTKRALKVFECICNYIYVSLLLLIKRPSVVHMQWLPLMDICGFEIQILKIFRTFTPSCKLVLTIHNVYPHNMNDNKKAAFNARFRKACSLIDEFIVHTEISKQDVIREFGLDPDKVNVCCHGVFIPEGVTPIVTNRLGGKLHILQFGGQSYYKGTDVLVDALCGMDKNTVDRIEAHIVGGISDQFLSELKEKDKDGIITWKPYFLDDDELHSEINSCDLIVLPYRAISQSGVLLLSIFFNKLIICSDLPSFKETMQGGEGDSLDEALFFKNEDSASLRNLIKRYVDQDVDEVAIHERIAHLKELYSWESAAKSTLYVYNKSR